MRLFQGALDTLLDSPVFATLSVHSLHFTVCAPSDVPCELPWDVMGYPTPKFFFVLFVRSLTIVFLLCDLGVG